MSKRLQDIAPAGQVWVCGACGKYNSNRYNIGDVSCFINAVLCYDDKTLKVKNGRVVTAQAVEEEKSTEDKRS